LAAGWSVTKTVENQVPDGWRSFDSRSFGITGSNGTDNVQVWVVPQTWVGIRQLPQDQYRVLFMDEFKVILIGDSTVAQMTDSWRAPFASLINGGARLANELFRDRMNAIDEETQTLINRFCGDRACRDEASLSLIVLGVPARAVNMDCAENGQGRAQEYCLRLLPDDNAETRRVFHKVLETPSSSTAARSAAAMSLVQAGADESSGPALLSAFRNEPAEIAPILTALANIGYRPAGKEILERMASEKVRIRAAFYAKTLASLRYAPAIPAIRNLSRTEDISSEWLLEEFQRLNMVSLDVPEVSLLRLIAPWGAASNGVRLLLVSPARIPASGRLQIAALIENESVRGFNGILLPFLYGTVIVDGKSYERQMNDPIIGSFGLSVNDVSARAIELPVEVLDGRTHRIQFRVGSAVSNELTLTLPRP
jgi:hypothetical protein